MPEWFEAWFGEEYLALYPHRDAEDAARLVALLHRVLGWGPGWRVLDIACGPGRHAAALDGEGMRVVGLDLSLALLRRARTVTGSPLVRADMRALPVRPGSMDAALSLFTSFGYFETDAEHAETLREMAGTVRPGGWFVLDFLNADAVRASVARLEPGLLVPGEAGSRVRRSLTPDGARVVKDILLPDGRHFLERVRLFSPAELERLLAGAGVECRHRFGDYAGGPLAADAPRCLLVGRKVA